MIYFIRPRFGIYGVNSNLYKPKLITEVRPNGLYIKGCVKRAYYISEGEYHTVTLHDFVKAYETLEQALVNYPSVCPESGSFVAYKKVLAHDPLPLDAIAKLLIPEDAQRVSSYGRKCRASKAKVLEINGFNGKSYDIAENRYAYNEHLLYPVGKMVYPNSFDPDRTQECTNGIHFFMTEYEAWCY